MAPAGLSVGRRVKGRACDHDAEGLRVRVRSPAGLAAGKKVFVAFRLPATISDSYHGLRCRWPARVQAVRADAERPGEADVVLRFEDGLEELTEREVAAHHRRVGLVLGTILLGMFWLKWDDMRFFWYAPTFYLYSFVVGGYFLSRFVICRLYEPPAYVEGYTPSLTVVISARNEEAAIESTIDSCFSADYPDDLREVVVVNDGSTDGTAEAIARAKLKHPELIARHIPPSGKREGMATGVRLAKGELVVFVDSDTWLFPDALKQIVSGFQDRTVGAVAGNAHVTNHDLNMLTAMQDVRYYLSFRLMKTAESVFSTVSCCPGCLSCYRREYLVKILDQWLHQRFLGAKATFGDDRSLTNFILRDYRVLYNERAISRTLVPETWERYMTQQVRWKKSWLRETWIAGKFIWRKHPVGALSFYAGAFCSLVSPLMVLRATVFSFIVPDTVVAYYVVGLILLGASQCLFVYLIRPSSRWLLAMLLVASQVVLMGPQTYYAILTMRKNHWGTR